MSDLFQFFLGNKSPWKMYVMAGTTWGRMPSLMSTARHVAKRPKQFMKNHSLERFLSVFLFVKKLCVCIPNHGKRNGELQESIYFLREPMCDPSVGLRSIHPFMEFQTCDIGKKLTNCAQKGSSPFIRKGWLFTLVSIVLDIQSSCFQSLPLGCKAGLSPFFPREVKSVPSSVGF
jgi:hypothetical protein